FEYNPMLAIRVHMGAKVALRDCVMEPQPESPNLPPGSNSSNPSGGAMTATAGAAAGSGFTSSSTSSSCSSACSFPQSSSSSSSASSSLVSSGAPPAAQPQQLQEDRQRSPQRIQLLDLDELRRREAEKGWAVGCVRSHCVQLLNRGTILSVDGRAFFGLVLEEEEGREKKEVRRQGTTS
ncbi:hypothetical protein Agub_g9836, partial [Astrephomene gubernaculifera]